MHNPIPCNVLRKNKNNTTLVIFNDKKKKLFNKCLNQECWFIFIIIFLSFFFWWGWVGKNPLLLHKVITLTKLFSFICFLIWDTLYLPFTAFIDLQKMTRLRLDFEGGKKGFCILYKFSISMNNNITDTIYQVAKQVENKYEQLRAKKALTLLNDFPLRTRRALLP